MIDLSRRDPGPVRPRVASRRDGPATPAPRPGPAVAAPTHLDLLAVARALRDASIGGDLQRVHVELSRLRTSLVHHLHAEQRREPRPASSGAALVVGDGQQRLLDLVDQVIFDVGSDRDGCNCLVRSVEVEVALRRQARLESAVLGSRPASGAAQPPGGTTHDG